MASRITLGTRLTCLPTARLNPDAIAYQAWQQQFFKQRLRWGLRIAIAAYPTFMGVKLIRGLIYPNEWDSVWFFMAFVSEISLVGCLWLSRTQIGRDRPALLFLAGSWSITILEQVWATLSGIAFPGLYAWTLAFMTLATLIPVRWQLHLISQLGLLIYYYGVNALLGLRPVQYPLWDAVQMVFLFWFCGICNLSVFLYERLQRAEFFARCALEREQEKSEKLLLNILPEAIAQQLKQDQRTIAESFAEVTVLFADIVGFTRICASIPATELVTLLNQIFSTFDELAEKHGLEKIKTIGDAYMVVGGLPLERPDHAEAIAQMALDMQDAIAQFSMEQNQPFSIRIGINTGPVIAGVIGTKKFIYDLWGDTVNVASRMESQGIPGQIQVTSDAYDRLHHAFLLKERGRIEIKGKGVMTTYLLQEKKAQKSLIRK
ncbi:MAG: adenylate/guanylate cyclase domain-containing protein [Oscillatoriophycideae cyanobacterium NC_groundwater_1537_Pr4_S-0.65um_50_18]|nr:adenylate/guanylate cyclase domain-containing protein [Oscillatoriophycideae cyanobacterium NC_groundwater_1537_Pr4_S-0.65um_50_18]